MDFEKKNKRLKYIAIACFVISLVLPVPIPVFNEISLSFEDAGIWYLILGWMIAFSSAGISWWANIFLLLSWFSQRNFKWSLIFNCIAVLFALTFIGNAHVFIGNMGIVGGAGSSSITQAEAFPGVGYVFWLASLVVFLFRSRINFLNHQDQANQEGK